MTEKTDVRRGPSGSDEIPRMECPQCHSERPDFDGFGWQGQCAICGYCNHPSLTGDVCDICGFVEAPPSPDGLTVQDEEVLCSSDIRPIEPPSGNAMEKMFHEMPLADLVDRIENYNSFESIGGSLRLCVDWQVLKARVLIPPAGSHEDAFNGGYALGRSDHARMRDGGHEVGSREGFRRWLTGRLLR